MATINGVQGKQDQEEEEKQEEEEEEEALSLCDLPITLINRKDQDQLTKQASPHINEEFDFRSWGSGLFSNEPEMCAADDVFFQGQILPLRFSFSSESGLITKRDYGNNQVINHNSESEFFQSNSSRSSSVRSQNSSSSSSTSSTTTNTPTTPRISKPRIIRNQFHTHPSPKPQLRISGPRQTSTLSSNQGRKSSSAWEFFRLGVVPAPEIALQDLKLRSSSNSSSANKNCVSRNSSNSSSSSSKSTKKSVVKIMSNKSTHHDGDKNNNHHHVFKGGGLLMRGCRCSVESVVGSDIVMIKGGTKSTKKKESTQHAVKEEKGVVELKKQKHRSQKQGKKVMSRRRTFEWLKELHACHDPDEEALLSNP